jgi:hypothetical protein
MREWVGSRDSLEKALKRKFFSSAGNQIVAVQIITQ